jgi:predicted metal-dependent hydrolase
MKPTDYSMPPDVERKLYYDGIQLFNDKEFFEAHEVWEDAWHMAYGLKFEFYQGMIQCAVALEHYRRSNPRGVLSLFASYNKHFKDVPDVFMGLDVKSFLQQMREVLEPVLTANPVPERGQIELDATTAPTIALQYDPFETGEAQRFGKPQ